MKKKIDTDERRIKKVFLTGRHIRPSQLLREFKLLVSSKMSDEIIKQLWTQRLPVSMQDILQVSFKFKPKKNDRNFKQQKSN